VSASEAACEYVHKDSQLAAQSGEVELYIRSRIRWAEIKLAYTLVTPWYTSWSGRGRRPNRASNGGWYLIVQMGCM
jgi:hypothetical protein